MLRSGNIPSLIQGVSQQPASLRLPTQLDLMENCYATAVEGLIRRPPTDYTAKISDTSLSTAFMHLIDRDLLERYHAIIHNRDVQVFTVDGVEKTVTGILTDSTLVLLNGATGVINGGAYQIAADPGETTIDFVLHSDDASTATVKLQGSEDGNTWEDMAELTPNGSVGTVTTPDIAIGTYIYMRGIVSAYTAGTIILSATLKRNTYLVSITPRADFTALTVADYTFIVNKTITPAMKATLTPTRNAEGLIFVRQGNYSSRYIVYIDGTLRADFTTSATVVAELATDFIADQLHDDLVAWGGASFTFTREGSTIHVVKDKSVDGTRLLIEGAVAVVNGNSVHIDATTGETAIDFVVSGITTATVKLQGSVNGTDWADLATRTTAGTTAGVAIGANLYMRGIVSAWTAGTITLGAVYKKTSFVLQTGDSQGGTSLKGFKDQTLLFTDLPTTAPDGFVIGIDSNPDTLAGAYYLRATSTQEQETFGEVTWQETVAPGLQYIIDPATMPHALIRGAGGDFTFEELEWTNRICGDDESNVEPSFIGTPILEVGFYKNRLAFLADEFFVFSETTEYFNFWRTTVTQILDTDPIDSRAVHTKVSILKHMIPFNTDLFLFADKTQFKIPGDVAFTPKTFRADPVSEFEGNLVAKPVNAGKSVYFLFNREEYAGLKNLYQSETIANIMDAEDLTGHAPSYIPSGVFRIAHSTLEGVTVLLTDGDPSSVYLYKTAFTKDGTKVQAAWFKWQMAQAGLEHLVEVLDAGFIESTLYLLIQRDGKVYQERVLLQPAREDVGAAYLTHLDQRFDHTILPAASYDAPTDRTLFTDLPYAPDGYFVVASEDGDVPVIASSTATTVTVVGDYSAIGMWFGQEYTSRFRPSTIYVRKPTANGGTVIDEVSRLQLRRGYLNYSNSGYFKVSVTPEGRAVSAYIFTGRDAAGDVALGSGRFSFAILSKNDRVILEISSDSILPFRFTSMEWEGEYTKRSKG